MERARAEAASALSIVADFSDPASEKRPYAQKKTLRSRAIYVVIGAFANSPECRFAIDESYPACDVTLRRILSRLYRPPVRAGRFILFYFYIKVDSHRVTRRFANA